MDQISEISSENDTLKCRVIENKIFFIFVLKGWTLAKTKAKTIWKITKQFHLMIEVNQELIKIEVKMRNRTISITVKEKTKWTSGSNKASLLSNSGLWW